MGMVIPRYSPEETWMAFRKCKRMSACCTWSPAHLIVSNRKGVLLRRKVPLPKGIQCDVSESGFLYSRLEEALYYTL